MYVGVVAGETSGDYLGAGLIEALRKQAPSLRLAGIGGPRMQALGAKSLFPMDSISIMGIDGLVRSLWHIIQIRRSLARFFVQDPPDVFVGIDVPDFNLGLEERLRRAGIPTVHYVSPTVWAWRGYRIHRIHRAVSHMLTLFPFEADYYRRHGIAVSFVGHPIADQIDEQDHSVRARAELDLPADGPVIALLPGSRVSELARHAQLFAQTARRLHRRRPAVHFVAPFVSAETRGAFERALADGGDALPLTIVEGQSRRAMAAADVVLLASGTAALEAALLRKPMVVTYRTSLIMKWVVRLFSHVDHYSMPNNLLRRPLIPELLQDEALPENLVAALEAYLDDPARVRDLQQQFAGIHRDLKRGASERAAQVVLRVAGAGA